MAEISESQVDPSWKIITIPAFSGGLNTSSLPDLIPAENLTVAKNMSLRNNKASIDTGYTILGRGGSNVGRWKNTSVWNKASSTKILGVTEHTVLVLDSISQRKLYTVVVAGKNITTTFIVSDADVAALAGWVNAEVTGAIQAAPGTPIRLSAVNAAPASGSRTITLTGVGSGETTFTGRLVFQPIASNINDDTVREEWKLASQGDADSDNWTSTVYQSANTGTTTILVAGITFLASLPVGTSIGDYYVSIPLMDGTEAQARPTNRAEVDGNTQLTFAVSPIPVDNGVLTGDAIKVGVYLSGGDNQISVASVPWGQTTTDDPWIVFTNNKQYPYYYDGAVVKKLPIDAFSGDVICRVVATYKGILILANCTIGGDPKPNTIVYSEIGDPESWLTGNAGAQDILEEGAEISALKSLGPDMIIYGPRSITKMQFVGSTNFLFQYVGAVSGSTHGKVSIGEGLGCVSPNAVFSTGDRHIFMAPNGIYSYNGGYTAELISQDINTEYFDIGGLIDYASLTKVFIAYLEEYRELYFFIPTTTDPTAFTHALVLDLNNVYSRKGPPIFRSREFSTPINGAGVAITQSSASWEGYSGTWESSPGSISWRSSILNIDSPTVTLGSIGVAKRDFTVQIVFNDPASAANYKKIGIAGGGEGGLDSNSYKVGDNFEYTQRNGIIRATTITDWDTVTISAFGSAYTYWYVKIAHPLGDSNPLEWPATLTPCWLRTSTGYRVYEINYKTSNDAEGPNEEPVPLGYSIPWEIQTKDFTSFTKELRTDMIDLALQGKDISVDISRDSGNTFTTLQSVTQSDIKQRTRIHTQGVSDSIRFRLSGSGGGATIGPIAIRFREEDKYRLV